MKKPFKIIFAIAILIAMIQKNNATTPLRRMRMPDTINISFYNCENFYDTKNDTSINDEEFLPTSHLKWDDDKYMIKKMHLAKLIASINRDKGPDLIGLSEVENKEVLEELVQEKQIKDKNYGIVHHNSPDLRGIDVAILYKKDVFEIKSQKAYPIHFQFDKESKTRDILVAEAKTVNSQIIYFMVIHAPSKRGGSLETEPKRIFVAQRARQIVDSMMQIDKKVKFIILGDLNDEPQNKSIKDELVKYNESEENGLINPFFDFTATKEGSYYYKGAWSCIDQIIISKSLLEFRSNPRFLVQSAKIYKPYFVLEQDGPYKGAPYRTYVGNTYKGGFSDHMSVNITLLLFR
jgi:predicted extracellular nuclease